MRINDLQLLLFIGTTLVCISFAFPQEGRAELSRFGGKFSLSSAGSPSDRVLWHLRPELALQYAHEFRQFEGLNLDLQVRGRADMQTPIGFSENYFDGKVDKLTLEWLGSRTSFAAGFQKLSWGGPSSFDGVDVVNAIDLSEPQYSDRELVKLAAPAFSFQFLGDNSIFQLVWVVLAQRSPVPESVNSIPVLKPRLLRFADDMEFSLKAGGLTKSGWDLSGYWSSHLERIPQWVVLNLPTGPVLELNEPRVFTFGLTSTQSISDVVLRFEFAHHSGRALPEVGLTEREVASQTVLQVGSDWNISDQSTLVGEFVAERWSRESSSGFESSLEYVALGVRRNSQNGSFETQFNLLFDPALKERLFSGRVAWKLSDVWQFDLDLNLVNTSKGRALARRQLKDLLRSELSFRF